jgi:hypothetical protein
VAEEGGEITVTKFALAVALLFFAAIASALDRNVLVRAWNEMCASVERQTDALQRVRESYRLSPPWLVIDEEQRKLRLELLDEAIREGEAQLKYLRVVRAEEAK